MSDSSLRLNLSVGRSLKRRVLCMHHGAMADSSRETYASMLAELLSLSSVAGLSVAAFLCLVVLV